MRARQLGFTLLELIVVLTLIGLLVGIALPAYRDATQRAKEATLREDLARMRGAIDEYHTDKGEYPPALQDLVTSGYLRSLPVDPLTGSDAGWQIEYAPWEMVEEGQVAGVFDVHSGADGLGLDGTPYAEW
jgi:general secretion pathway protein G